MNKSYLNVLITDSSKANLEPSIDINSKDLESNVIISFLVYKGLKALLPELKEWVKLGVSVITTKRLELRNKLANYAAEKGIEYLEAEAAAEKICQNINEKNFSQIIQEIERVDGEDVQK